MRLKTYSCNGSSDHRVVQTRCRFGRGGGDPSKCSGRRQSGVPQTSHRTGGGMVASMKILSSSHCGNKWTSLIAPSNWFVRERCRLPESARPGIGTENLYHLASSARIWSVFRNILPTWVRLFNHCGVMCCLTPRSLRNAE